jgi:predicted nucleic acid-binding protein
VHAKPAVIDTNVLVFDSFEDSEHYEEEESLLNDLQRWIIPGIVIHEYVWVLKGLDLPLSFLRSKVREYLLNEKTSFSPTNIGNINYALKNMEKITEYNDLLILSTALRDDQYLASFDEKLRSRAETLGLETLPKF